MIKRSESKSKNNSRGRTNRLKKRRLQMEGLEKRQLLAVLTEPPTQPAPTDLPEFTQNRNIGAVQSFQFIESETARDAGLNDIMSNADLIPLGTGPGQQDTIDVSGSVPVSTFVDNTSGFQSDIDTFAADLRGGDILDIATLGAAGGITVRNADGTMILASDILIGGRDAPLQTIGNAVGTVVIPEDGRYFITTSPFGTSTGGAYTLGLRVYRPTSESLPIGDTQILYLDFAGDVIDNNIFNAALVTGNPGLPVGGVTRVRSLVDSLPILGLQLGDVATANRIIDDVVFHVSRIFEDLVRTGGNGDIEAPGAQPGDYGIRILNSRDHAGQVSLDDPRVSRLLIGGTGGDFGVGGVFGIAQSVDIGNFDLSEFGIFALDGFAANAQGAQAGGQIAPSRSTIDFMSFFLASVAAHEAGHTFGMIHTDNTDSIGTLSDSGGGLADIYGQGLGADLIFGTADDILPVFNDDFYAPGEPPDLNGFSINFVTNALAHSLSSGTVGATISGRVFEDVNANGSGTGDPGAAGFTVFADIDNDGVQDPDEPSDITGTDGVFSLPVPAGTISVIVLDQAGFAPTTPTTVAAASGSTGVDFGFRAVSPDITGTVFVDSNGNSVFDTDEIGREGVYVFVDRDGDDRPDLSEPGDTTGPDGTYSLTFPGPGTFTVRAIVPAGFEQSFPSLDDPTFGEHTVVFTGGALSNNFDFGLLAAQDFGDAPNTYGTTVAVDGASHGIVSGLMIGASVDRETDGAPSTNATGDDVAGIDDEDGLRVLTPIGPGAVATVEVTVTNTSGATAFLQGWFDANGDGVFGAGEQFATDVAVPDGSVATPLALGLAVPATTLPGQTFTRFRLSQDSGLGPTGFSTSGEVEDHAVTVLSAANVANPDSFTVSRNSLSNPLDVLANDFQTAENPLVIDSLNVAGTAGIVVRSNDQTSLFYTPPNGFVGRDTFTYTVVDTVGNRATATVEVNVNFQSQVPIAVDDTFEVSEGSVNRALNVLANDVPSIFGGLSITSVTAGTAGGNLSIVGGGQSLRYTPAPGFNGTEQFVYSVQDGAGSTSTATGTINLLPGSRADDVVDISIEILDPVNNRPVTNVQVGDDILVRVSVEDLRTFVSPEGVASAFLDLLYSDALISTLNTDNNPDFPFDITFGPLFSGVNVLQGGNSQTPGLIDEVGGVQRIDDQQEHDGPTELFTLRMRAVAAGVAVFAADPADNAQSETAVLGSDNPLAVNQLRLGQAELIIVPAVANFTTAIDDSFPDSRDSDGNLITNSAAERNVLRVLDNDNLGPTGTVREFGLVTDPSLGNVTIDDNGTPDNLNDDFFSYRANAGADGLERFTYVIVTDDNIRSTAEVTIALGNQNANALVAYDFNLVNEAGSPITSVAVGQRFGVQVIAEDLRFNPTSVFAGFLDVLYDQSLFQPTTVNPGPFGFDVVYGPGYIGDPDVNTALTNGNIDEFGTVSQNIPPTISNPAVLATLFFQATSAGTGNITGSPAEADPISETLLTGVDTPVDPAGIRYDKLTITVGGGGVAPLQNAGLPQDVNDDGVVSPRDALLVINQLSRQWLEGETAGPQSTQYYTDVNGDSRTSALDALQILNFLKQQSDLRLQAEMEQPSDADLGTSDNDEVFATLDEDDPETIASYNGGSSPGSTSVEVAGNSGTSDDDEDTVLDLLADDVSSHWS